MRNVLGEALGGFDDALRRLRAALGPDRVLSEAVFAGSDVWVKLLRYKLLPHFGEAGCLVVAVAGGTNTGKSSVFNLLLGENVSPVEATAAATRRPLLAASPKRAAQCLRGELAPEFKPRPFDAPSLLLTNETPDDTLFVAVVDGLPDHVVFLDTPDVDSLERGNWSVAENVQAAGDVVVAVVTGEKYKDDRVVSFFRQAHASGRVVIPVMNKADGARDYEVARAQLAEFRADVGLASPCFVVAYGKQTPGRRGQVRSLESGPHLLEYCLSLDGPAIKEKVYRDTIAHFAARTGQFLDATAATGEGLRSVLVEFERRAAAFSGKYDPAPGAEVGGLFHAFVQNKRGPVRRWIGATSKGVVHGATAAARFVARAVRRRVQLESPERRATEAEIREGHAQSVQRIARELAASYVESVGNFREPAAHLLATRVAALDVEGAAQAVAAQVIEADTISATFRRHANDLLERWWRDHAGKRRALEALDAVLAVTPAAIAAPLAVYTAGIGVSEAMVVAGPVVEQFVARVIEYQFGDAMFDFLSPWRAEQRGRLKQALLDHITDPCTGELDGYLEVLEGDIMADLRRWHQACMNP